MIDLKKITNTLEAKSCVIHKEKPYISITTGNTINLKTCCPKFKIELETTYKNEVTIQTQEAIKRLFKK